MPGLWGLLNHSRERSLRLVTPVSGLFMVSPAVHTPLYGASLCVVLIEGRCLHHGPDFANSEMVGKTTWQDDKHFQNLPLLGPTTLIQRHPQKSLIRA